ncbi:hypothetical protein HPB49_000753 [Dermacentor silvarum]|uniref:Uncharacterized protein n=1 Tax=Dermacentor silvarum TaxID=543639 RepID=A0ACB8CIT2_DERSI|nr:hypothetical protein HPB49_000753 [Dermacentor silvarum]
MAPAVTSLNGRLALVTGGASGIGEAVCRALASEGATVVIADRQLESARRVAQSLPGEAEHHTVYADVSDSSSVEQLFADIRSKFSQPLSIVVNCAGILLSAPITDCSDELFDDVIRVNLRAGVVALTKSAAQELAAHGIRCNAVLPAMTDTPMSASAGESHKAMAVARIPLKRVAQPWELPYFPTFADGLFTMVFPERFAAVTVVPDDS